jgi:hypothetical protein
MCIDVFEEHLLGLDFADDARDVRPEMARILRPALLARARERLARIPGSDRMNLAAPRLAFKGFKIAPNWGIIQRAVLHTRDQDAACSNFPFHETLRDKAGVGQAEAEIEPSVSGTEGEHSLGR